MWLLHLRNRHFLLADVLIILASPLIALALRDDPGSWAGYSHALGWFIGLALLIKLPIFYRLGFYNRYWRYASTNELLTIGSGVFLTMGLLTGAFASAWMFGVFSPNGFPRSVPLLDGMLTLLLVGSVRFSVRVVRDIQLTSRKSNQRRVLIVGAGDAGSLIARELRAVRSQPQAELDLIGFVDDDRQKLGMQIHGVSVVGALPDLAALIQKHGIQEVIIAMPAAPGKVVRQVVAVCDSARVTSRILPAFSDLVSGQASVTRLRNVQIEDLLRREPIQVDMHGIAEIVRGKRILVTGAGGSIGSELCRQLLRFAPEQLILLGHGEHSLFQLTNELPRYRTTESQTDFQVIVADVRDLPRMQFIFERYKPQLVFHAAAHKHVPLMEANIEDAVSNNILGTRNVVELSEAFGVERFVLISSDKAVNPVSIMGATKRVAERLVGEVAQRSGRPYVAVRFGNVLGSRGSVVPVFKQQIADGGPVTVTHPEMRRYFMTIPEAVQLVLQAAALSEQGEVFILDMGQPIKIADLASDLIKLSGLQVGRDIDLVFTGLRPGEKLHEDLFLDDEEYQRTAHSQIFVVSQGFAAPAEPTSISLREQIDHLLATAQRGQTGEVRRGLKAIVPEYEPPLTVLKASETGLVEMPLANVPNPVRQSIPKSGD